MEGLEKRLADFSAYTALQKGFSKSTRKGYCRLISKALRDIGCLDPAHEQLNAYMLGLIDSEPSYTHIANTMRAIEAFSHFQKDPLTFHRPRKPKPVMRDTLTEAEVVIVLSACKNIRERAILSLFADSGIRCGELCNTLVKDIDIGRGTIKVRGKAKRDAISFIGGDCAQVIQQYLAVYPRDPDSHLFTTLRHGEPMTTWGIRKMVRGIAGRSKVCKRVHPHLFRHSLATNMLGRGANPITIQEQLRHAYISTTMLYVHARKDHVRAEMDLFRPRYH